MRRGPGASRAAKLRFHVFCVVLSGCFLAVDVCIHLTKTLFAAMSTWTSVLNVLYFGFSVYADVTSKNTRAWLPPRDRYVASGHVWLHVCCCPRVGLFTFGQERATRSHAPRHRFLIVQSCMALSQSLLFFGLMLPFTPALIHTTHACQDSLDDIFRKCTSILGLIEVLAVNEHAGPTRIH